MAAAGVRENGHSLSGPLSRNHPIPRNHPIQLAAIGSPFASNIPSKSAVLR